MSGSTERGELPGRYEMGWTGGQYSLVRVMLAYAVLVNFAPDDIIVTTANWVLVALLLVGLMDRLAAAGLLVLCLIQSPPGNWALDLWSLPVLELVLIGHMLQTPKPFGALSARGRVDPDGGWRPRVWIHQGLGLCFALSHGACGLDALIEAFASSGAAEAIWRWPQVLSALQVAVFPLCLWTRSRPWAWIIAVTVTLALLPRAPLSLWALAVIHLVWVEPRWFGPPASTKTRVFYDGDCGLCHRAVRFWLAEDWRGDALRFAPIGGEAYSDTFSPSQRAEMPDSIVVHTALGEPAVYSRAIIIGFRALGGLWRPVATLIWLIPSPIRDPVYRGIAAIRKSIFSRPDAACPLIPGQLRSRFIFDDEPTRPHPTETALGAEDKV